MAQGKVQWQAPMKYELNFLEFIDEFSDCWLFRRHCAVLSLLLVSVTLSALHALIFYVPLMHLLLLVSIGLQGVTLQVSSDAIKTNLSHHRRCRVCSHFQVWR